MVRLPRVIKPYNHSAARQGDYFFPFVAVLIRTTIKEISVKVNIENAIIKDIVSYVLIRTTFFPAK